MDYWNGLLEWTTTGMDYWNGLLEWTTGMDYWNGLLEWTTGMLKFSHKNPSLANKGVGFYDYLAVGHRWCDNAIWLVFPQHSVVI